jgi:hypothetical protein
VGGWRGARIRSGDVGGDFGVVGDLVGNEPGAVAIFEMDLGAPQHVAMLTAVDLVDHAVEIGPGKTVAIVPGNAVFGELFDGTGLAAADEPEENGEYQDRHRRPENAVQPETVFQLDDRAEKKWNEEEREDRKADDDGLV